MTSPRSARRGLVGAPLLIVMGLAACSDTSPLLQGGIGSTESEAFHLPAGSYQLGWTASPQTAEGCELRIELRGAGDEVPFALVTETFDSGGARQAAEDVGELSTGEYRLRVASTCESWTAVIGEGARKGD